MVKKKKDHSIFMLPLAIQISQIHMHNHVLQRWELSEMKKHHGTYSDGAELSCIDDEPSALNV